MLFRGPLLATLINFIESKLSLDEIENIFLYVNMPKDFALRDPYEDKASYVTKIIKGLQADGWLDMLEAILREVARRRKEDFDPAYPLSEVAKKLITALYAEDYCIKDGELVEIEEEEDPAKRAEEEQRQKTQDTIRKLDDLGMYGKILNGIQNCGKGLEVSPSTYEGKGEEALRDLFLFGLKGIFGEIASITGESLNSRGKTDIMLKQNNTTLFIAECKIWSGEKGFLEGITQLFSYLTWRDTQAALIVFVQDVISLPLQKVKESTSKHSNYVKPLDEIDTNWINYRFHIDNDPGIEVTVAVMLFHLKEVK